MYERRILLSIHSWALTSGLSLTSILPTVTQHNHESVFDLEVSVLFCQITPWTPPEHTRHDAYQQHYTHHYYVASFSAHVPGVHASVLCYQVEASPTQKRRQDILLPL
jgi:hypothetical protein